MTARHVPPLEQLVPDQDRRRFGRAFTVEESLLAMRWADLVGPYGFRLTFSHEFAGADEIIRVHIPPITRAVANVYLGTCRVWVTDCVGQARSYESLAVALASVVPLSRHETRVMTTPRTPPWLWTFRNAPPPRKGWVRRLAAVLTQRVAGRPRC